MDSNTDEDGGVKKKKNRVLDFSKYPERRIAILFQYLGWEFDGMVSQPGNENTTEYALLSTMERIKLIRNKEYAKWNRCGRTDKNVSGFRQVGSCIVRSTDINGKFILNHNLPPGVRILAWAPVDPEFNARYNCTQRAYSYIFPQANFDIQQMRQACNLLVGLHDFRNICQIDCSDDRLNTTYERQIFLAEINQMSADEHNPVNSMFQLKIRGSGFLWHQIRFIVSLLVEIGSGNEEPTLISELLDIQKNPARPQYTMAKDLPLCFFDCLYNEEMNWIFDLNVLKDVYLTLQKMWIEMRTKAEQIKLMMNQIEIMAQPNQIDDITDGMTQFIRDRRPPANYVPIMKRPLCDTLEERKAKAINKKKLRLETDS
ncbi:PseudoU-synth-1 domain-containing protein [Aphelenchoides bicaudatus]|nr:PseudoU-synth-1 domain-containing protein [Aphelenchoides bicaudatus]